MFDEVLSESPNDATVLTLSGMAMSGRGDYKGARRQFDHAIRVDRQNLDAHREQGVALAKLGDAKAAQAELDWLKAKQKACAGKCDDPGKIDRAVDTVQTAITPAAPKKG
jgi:Flp pilus assembly protein TadD